MIRLVNLAMVVVLALTAALAQSQEGVGKATKAATPAKEIDLSLWYVAANLPLEKSRLLERSSLPKTNGKEYYELLMPEQGKSVFVDNGAPLVGANQAHFVVLYPEGEIKGAAEETWLGVLPAQTGIGSAKLRIWCTNSGKWSLATSGGLSRVSVVLRQYNALPSDAANFGAPVWEGRAEFEIEKSTWDLYTIDLKPQPLGEVTRGGQVQVVALTVRAEAGETVAVSTAQVPPPNPAMPVGEILATMQRLRQPTTVLRHRGVVIDAAAVRVTSSVLIMPRTIASPLPKQVIRTVPKR